jgi:hypothetical protein
VHIISQKFGESSLTLKAEKDKAATLACWAETKIVVSHVGPPVTTTGAAAFGAAAGPTTSCRPPLYIHTRTGRLERVRWATGKPHRILSTAAACIPPRRSLGYALAALHLV